MPSIQSHFTLVALGFLVFIVAALLVYKLLFINGPASTGLKLPPGPPRLPILGNWLQFRDGALTPKTLKEVSRTYGDVCMLRLGRCNLVVVSSPEAAKEVLQTQGEAFGSRSRNMVMEMTSGKGQDIAFADYGSHWRKMRRIANAPFFAKKGVDQCTAQREEEIDLAIRDLKESSKVAGNSKGIPIRSRLQLAIYNVLYRMMFDRRFQSLVDPVYKQISRTNLDNGILAQGFQYNVAEFFPLLRPFFRSFMNKVWKANQLRHRLLEDVFISEHRKIRDPKKVAGVDFLLDAEAKGEIDMKNILYLLQNLNVGALGTTTAMSKWAVAELVNHPKVQDQILDELVNVLGEKAVLTEADVERLPYLQSVVKETLRMHMAVYLLVPHMNLHLAKLGGYDIPARSRIYVNAWGIARDPRFWDKPDEFLPERFMVDKIEPFGSDFRLLPFGCGRRSCPGSRMAFLMLALIIGKLVQAFEVLPPIGVDKVDTSEFMGQLNYFMAKGLAVVLKERE